MSEISGKRDWGVPSFVFGDFFQRLQKYSFLGKNGRFKWICLGMLWVLALFGCATPFRGKVIDADSREPIEGAVVVAYWLEARATVAGESTRLEEVKETLTDKEGKWSISGPRGQEGCNPVLLLTFLTGAHYTREPYFVVFKPGYCSFPKGFFVDACAGKLKPGGAGGIYEGKDVELPKLKERQDRWRNLPSPETPTDEKRYKDFLKKQIEFLKFIDEERKYLDLSEMYREFKHEK